MGAVEYSRTFALEDLSIRTGPHEDGRTVLAYAAAFDVPAEIRDHDGEYSEVIDPRAFNKAVNDARPAGQRSSWKCGVFFNHARTLYGTPSELHSVPIGVCLDIKADSRGLLTTTRYLPGAENILDAIREGALTAYSFQGRFLRSTPQSGRFRRDSGGRLPVVRRLECSLVEYGPTPSPAYAEAAIVGVRANHREKIDSLRREYSALEAQRIIAAGPVSAGGRSRSRLDDLPPVAAYRRVPLRGER